MRPIGTTNLRSMNRGEAELSVFLAKIFDLLNNPARTHLMRQAEQADLRAVNGWNMLVYQGAAAFAKWTGVEPPVDVMKHALAQSMKEE